MGGLRVGRGWDVGWFASRWMVGRGWFASRWKVRRYEGWMWVVYEGEEVGGFARGWRVGRG